MFFLTDDKDNYQTIARKTLQRLQTWHIMMKDNWKFEAMYPMLWNFKLQCNLDLVTLLVSAKFVTKSHNVTKSNNVTKTNEIMQQIEKWSQVVTELNVTKSRLHCNIFWFFDEHSIGSMKKIDEQVRCIEEINCIARSKFRVKKTLKLMKITD